MVNGLSKTKATRLRGKQTVPLFSSAIVGAGIGGTSSAYYLRKKFGKDVKIDVFEREEVGGRLATLKVQGHDYEAGGSVIHPLNLHMKRFVKDLGMCLGLRAKQISV